ncbi:hypothetical protein BKA65DRAFT_601167 [Rhexocercosporidium sp. MPI-PUGE-AT-0058]|nr:hypothetical protein BKA65DRAFT_601167 [Rhexocercosporidium sp. MPI-PUGE-AT-0058]
MHYGSSFSAILFSLPLIVLPSMAALTKLISTADTHIILIVYSSNNFGGTKTTFSGLYSTCYGIPDEFQTKIMSLKLGDDIKSCHLYKQAGCSKPGGQLIYTEDQRDFNLRRCKAWSVSMGVTIELWEYSLGSWMCILCSSYSGIIVVFLVQLG